MSGIARDYATAVEQAITAILAKVLGRWKLQNRSEPFPHDEHHKFIEENDQAHRARTRAALDDVMRNAKGGA